MSTIKDVASLANTSIATVSRVLNNDRSYKINEATRQQVLLAAAQLGYSSRKKVADVGQAVGCILGIAKNKYADVYFMSIIDSAEKALKQQGVSLKFIKTMDEFADQHELAQTIESVPNIILMENLKAGEYNAVRQHAGHVVGVDTSYTDIDNIGYDHFLEGSRITEHLISSGHTRICYVGGSCHEQSLQQSQRYLGYWTTMQRHGLSVDPKWAIDCRWEHELCAKLVRDIMGMPSPPTAIFAGSDFMAMAALTALHDMNIAVPQKVAVMGLSDIELARYANPPLSTVRVPTDAIGQLAVKTLLERIAGDRSLPKRILIPCQMILRESA